MCLYKFHPQVVAAKNGKRVKKGIDECLLYIMAQKYVYTNSKIQIKFESTL